jgi:hypothetical protein
MNWYLALGGIQQHRLELSLALIDSQSTGYNITTLLFRQLLLGAVHR